MKDFPTLLKELLMMEHGRTAEAEILVKKHTNIVMTGIMHGLTFSSLRASAGAIELAESEESKQ